RPNIGRETERHLSRRLRISESGSRLRQVPCRKASCRTTRSGGTRRRRLRSQCGRADGQILRHARQYYRRADGTPTNEVQQYIATIRVVRGLYGFTPATAFDSLALK